MKSMKSLTVLLCFLINVKTQAAPIILTVGPPSDVDCDFNDLQTSIDSDELNMDIRVSNQLATSGGVTVFNQPVTFLRGGYDNCAAARNDVLPPVPTFSTISNAQGYGMNFLVTPTRQSGSINTGLSGISESINIEITGFEIFASDGGMQFRNTHVDKLYQVNLHNLNIHDNSDHGINFSGNNIEATLDHIQIHHNSNVIGGSTQGGGIRCFESQLNLGTQTAIYENAADLGAGIYAANCQIEVFAGDVFNPDLIETGIYANTANNYGGGLYLYNSTLNGFGQFDHSLNISNNAALSADNLGYGGGIYFTSGSIINLVNTTIEYNQASSRGGAIAAHHFDLTLPAPILTMGRGALGCSYARICSSISFNEVLAVTGIGATVYLRNGAKTAINQTVIANNQAATHSGFYLSGALSSASLESSLIYGNNSTIAGDLAQTLFKLTGSSSVELRFNTLADNAVTTLFDLGFDNNAPQNLEIYNSVISNTGSQIIEHNSGEDDHDANIDCSLLHDLSTGGIEGNGTQQGLPLFFSSTDYQLQENSLGIDSPCSGIITPQYLDLNGEDRSLDGAADLGAYESVVADSVIFANGFE